MIIMLVDDEYISSFINKKLIEKIDASIPTIEFNNPVLAFNSLHSIKPNLIFLDINMPVMNGWNFLDKMEAEAMTYKVVILTSSVNMIDRKMAANYKNVIGFIEKPATIINITPYIAQLMPAEA